MSAVERMQEDAKLRGLFVTIYKLYVCVLIDIRLTCYIL